MSAMDRIAIYNDISDERRRQHEKFGDQVEMGCMFMLAVLTEEVGEVAQAAIELDVSLDQEHDSVRNHYLARIRAELVQVAAVAVQMIEHIDRDAA